MWAAAASVARIYVPILWVTPLFRGQGGMRNLFLFFF